jgi:hypothetical protein
MAHYLILLISLIINLKHTILLVVRKNIGNDSKINSLILETVNKSTSIE